MSALKTGNYADAYALCTPDLQKQLGSASRIASLSQNHRPAQWSWSSRSVRNGVGYLDGPFTYTDGKAGNAHLVLHQVGKDWKLSSFNLNMNAP